MQQPRTGLSVTGVVIGSTVMSSRWGETGGHRSLVEGLTRTKYAYLVRYRLCSGLANGPPRLDVGSPGVSIDEDVTCPPGVQRSGFL